MMTQLDFDASIASEREREAVLGPMERRAEQRERELNARIRRIGEASR